MNIAILAGGTGGHIFPALAVAKALEQKGHAVTWVGAMNGMETKIVPEHQLSLETVHIQNLRGKGLLRHALLPFRLLRAMMEARAILKRKKINLVLGFGGFVAGPGGLAAKSLGIPLIIHEQNAVEGMTNRYLARIAKIILAGFASSFDGYENKVVTGNPVRADLLALREIPYVPHDPLRVLVIGGSLGAQVFNEVIPLCLKQLSQKSHIELWQQTGIKHFEETKKRFEALGIKAKVTAFIDDMVSAYGESDLIICRAGALTVAELALVGRPAIFVPFPGAVDDHQTKNAFEAERAGGAILIPQAEFSAENLTEVLLNFIKDKQRLSEMALKMKALGRVDATEQVVSICENFLIS